MCLYSAFSFSSSQSLVHFYKRQKLAFDFIPLVFIIIIIIIITIVAGLPFFFLFLPGWETVIDVCNQPSDAGTTAQKTRVTDRWRRRVYQDVAAHCRCLQPWNDLFAFDITTSPVVTLINEKKPLFGPFPCCIFSPPPPLCHPPPPPPPPTSCDFSLYICLPSLQRWQLLNFLVGKKLNANIFEDNGTHL